MKKTKTTTPPPSPLPTFSSMQACEAATGIPKAIQQQAKRDGCQAFDQANRVHLEPLLRFLFAPGEDGENQNWSDRKKRADALTAEHELEVLRGNVVTLPAVQDDQRQIANKLAAVLRTKFETELPPKLDGAPTLKIAEKNREALDQCFRILTESKFAP